MKKLLILLLALLILPTVHAYDLPPETARQMDEQETYNNWGITWYITKQGLTEQEAIACVHNQLSVNRDLDLTLFIDNTNFPIEEISGIKSFDEWKNISHIITVADYENQSYNFTTYEEWIDPYLGYNHTIETNETRWHMVKVGEHQEERWYYDWSEAKAQTFTRTAKVYKENMGLINIPKTSPDEQGIKCFKMSFNTPSVQMESGWGSVGRFGFIDEATRHVYHPVWNTTITNKNEITISADVGTTINITISTNTTYCNAYNGTDVEDFYLIKNDTTEISAVNLTAFNSSTTLIAFLYDDATATYSAYCGNTTPVGVIAKRDWKEVWKYYGGYFNNLTDGALRGQDSWLGAGDSFAIAGTNVYEGGKAVDQGAQEVDNWLSIPSMVGNPVVISWYTKMDVPSATNDFYFLGGWNSSEPNRDSPLSIAWYNGIVDIWDGDAWLGSQGTNTPWINWMYVEFRHYNSSWVEIWNGTNPTDIQRLNGGTISYDPDGDYNLEGIWISGMGLDQYNFDYLGIGHLDDDASYSLGGWTAISAPPTVTILSPENISYAVTSLWVNVTLDDDSGNVTTEVTDANTSVYNVTLINQSGDWNYYLVGLTEGNHNIRIYANNSGGDMNNDEIVYFTVDLTAPTDVTIEQPTNTSYSSLDNIWINGSMVDPNPANMTAQINDANGSTYNVSMTNSSGNWNVQNEFSIGTHSIIFFGNDTAGNMNTSSLRWFTTDNVTVTQIFPLNNTNGSSSTTSFIFLPNQSIYTWLNTTLHIGGDETGTATNTSAITNNANNTINYTFIASGNYTWYVVACTLESGCVTSATWDFELAEGNVTIEVYSELTNLLVNGSTYVALLNPDNYEVLYSGNASNGTIYIQALAQDYILRAGKIGDANYPSPRERPITITFDTSGKYTTYIYQPDTSDTVYNINFQKNDYTGCYRENVTLELRKSINGTWKTIHKRKFDAAQIVWTYLIANEDYELRVDSPASCGGVRVLDFITAREAGTFYLDIGDIEYHPDLIKTSWADIYYRIYWDHDASAMRLEYNDTTDDTIGVNFYVYNGSNLSQLVYSTTVNSSYAIVTYAGNENYTYLGVIEATTNTYGTGRFSDMVMKNLPVRRIDFGLPSDMAWLYTAISWIVIIFTAMLFGPKNSHIGGGIVTAQLLLFYYGFGWITFSSGRVAGFTISLVGLLALLNILTKKREVAVR